eukprot:UN22454
MMKNMYQNSWRKITTFFLRPYGWKPNYSTSSRKEIPIGTLVCFFKLKFPIGILVCFFQTKIPIGNSL